MVPPINDIPWEKALEIHDRHQQELLKLPGLLATFGEVKRMRYLFFIDTRKTGAAKWRESFHIPQLFASSEC